MTAIVETSTYTSTITQIETSDLVLGGVGGPSNRALVELANRTKWLYDRIVSLTEQPFSALPFPTIATSTNKMTVDRSTTTAGGRVSVAAGTMLTLSEVAVASSTGCLRSFTTPAWISASLSISSIYYLRAQVDANGDLLLYMQKGTDADAIPGTQIGTPDGLSGGGFDSTRVDMLIAKVVTGVAGSLPTVTPLANAATFNLHQYGRLIGSSSSAVLTLNLARAITPSLNIQGANIWGTSGALTAATYLDGVAVKYSTTVMPDWSQSVWIAFISAFSRYSATVTYHLKETNGYEPDNEIYYDLAIN